MYYNVNRNATIMQTTEGDTVSPQLQVQSGVMQQTALVGGKGQLIRTKVCGVYVQILPNTADENITQHAVECIQERVMSGEQALQVHRCISDCVSKKI